MRVQQFFLLSSYFALCALAGPSSRFIAPVANLEKSIAASVARRTTVAVTVNDECCLLITRFPKEESSALEVMFETEPKDCVDDNAILDMEGLPVRSFQQSFGRQWISRLTRSSVLCMTGFAADVAHLTRVIEREVLNYQAVYEKPHPAHKTIRSLSQMLKRETHSSEDNSRPFGVAAMVVGRSRNSDTWRMYTVDPSATWRAPGSSVSVIGRSSIAIEKSLHEELSDGIRDMPATRFLQLTIQSILKTLYDEDNVIDSEMFECLLLVWNGNRCKVYAVDYDYVEQQYKACVKQIAEGD